MKPRIYFNGRRNRFVIHYDFSVGKATRHELMRAIQFVRELNLKRGIQ